MPAPGYAPYCFQLRLGSISSAGQPGQTEGHPLISVVTRAAGPVWLQADAG
jgi:hypothetical protein